MKDLKHLIWFEDLLQQANNELVQRAAAEGQLALGYNCYYIPEVLLNLPGCFSSRLRAPNSGTAEIASYYMTNRNCPYVRCILERAIEGGFNYLGALFGAEGCAAMERMEEHFFLLKPVENERFFVTIIDPPMKGDRTSLDYYKAQLKEKVLDKLHQVYGIDTSERAGKTNQGLPAKERYRPWDGSPMQGAVELVWRGREITIERTTAGRIPMGVFRAYETAGGAPVPELTGENCGKLLCGVERSVFERTAFIRQLGMTVTEDAQLEQRLNALVTTGEEGKSYSQLEKELKNLKNKCSYRGSGQIPRLNARIAELEENIRQAKNCVEMVAANPRWTKIVKTYSGLALEVLKGAGK